MNVTLRQLRAFLAIARTGSFTAAAEGLFVTQSALSSLIKELESSLGVQVIDRAPRRTQLSDIGNELLGDDKVRGKALRQSLADRFGVKLETEEESPEAAAKRARRERLYGLLARVTTYYERYFWESTQAQEARDYMLGRGLTEDTLREFEDFDEKDWA